MKFKIINLFEKEPKDLPTEVAFELASARADKIELVRLNIAMGEDSAEGKKRTSAISRVLKNMKSTGQIQFYATSESFARISTEARFLINKYPDALEIQESAEQSYFYVKL